MSIIQNYISSLAGQALNPTVDTPTTPTPFDDEKRKDIGFGKFGISRGDSSVGSSPPSSTDGEDSDNYSGSGKFSGTSGSNTLTVDQILTEDGTIKPKQGYFDSLSGKYYIDPVTGQLKKGFPTGLGTFLPAPIGFLAGAGLAISNKVLSGISDKVKEGKEGYGIASVNGKTVGVSKGLFGGYVLTGNIPDNITAKQRQNLIDQILNTKAPAPKPKETLTPAVKTPLPNDNNDPVFDDDRYSGVGPSPDDGGSMGDPGYYPSNVSDSLYTGRPDDSPSTPDEAGGDEPDYGGGMQDDYDSGIDGPGGAKGGRVGLKGGGAAGKAPSTGFIDGPPQNYSKGMTVADTEDMKVRVGSFVINAPTTERLQKEGKLPKGPQKRKAAKGGKMMDVALSKGEYLIDVADIEKFGGYDALNAENDKGKAEVDRRQAAASGGFINGYQYGGSTGIKAGPLSTVELMKSGLNLTNPTPSSFMEFDSGDLAPYTVNGINVGNVQKALTLVETRGYQDRNEGYFFTRADTSGKESSAFGPLQITKKTLEGMVSDNFGELELAFKTEPGFKEYYNKMIVEGRNAVNVKKYKDIYVGPEGSARPTYASEEEKAKYKGLGYGNIPIDEHKKHYPTLASVYMNYKAGMSKSEKDLVVKHFGNKKSLKKYQDAKKELGIK